MFLITGVMQDKTKSSDGQDNFLFKDGGNNNKHRLNIATDVLINRWLLKQHNTEWKNLNRLFFIGFRKS